jgi:hypothetical protein
MSLENFESHNEQVDQATAGRLAKLRSMPVDTSRLDRMIQARIPRETEVRSTHWLRPLRMAIAACLMAAIGLFAFLIGTSGGPVMASTTEMAQFHEDLVSGRVPAMRVDSVQAANKALAAQWAESPQLPNVPKEHVMACCMREVKNKKMACVLLKGDGEPVTMTVANISDVKLPSGPIITRDHIAYHVTSVGNLNMVMTQRQSRWICLIGKLPADRLMDLATSMQF